MNRLTLKLAKRSAREASMWYCKNVASETNNSKRKQNQQQNWKNKHATTEAYWPDSQVGPPFNETVCPEVVPVLCPSWLILADNRQNWNPVKTDHCQLCTNTDYVIPIVTEKLVIWTGKLGTLALTKSRVSKKMREQSVLQIKKTSPLTSAENPWKTLSSGRHLQFQLTTVRKPRWSDKKKRFLIKVESLMLVPNGKHSVIDQFDG